MTTHHDDETGPDDVSRVARSWLTEDWAAVIVGLALIAAVLIGIIPGGVIP
ncbi:MAG: hypothetical protein PGN29_08640 [Gordonia paraffinivorans]